MKLPTAFRSVVFWMHLALGVCAGVIIFVMSVTGALLGFKPQILLWVYGTPRVVSVGDTVRLPLDTLFARASIRPGDVESMVLKTDARMGVMVRFRDRQRLPVILDPFTAASLARPQPGRVRDFFDAVSRWHEALGAESDVLRPFGVAAVGAANLVFVLMIPLGLLLWWPAAWTVAMVRTTMFFKRGLTARARDFNWHHVLGLWCAPALFLIALSGVFMSYEWPTLWLDRALGSPDEKASAIAAMRGPETRAGQTPMPMPSTTGAPSTAAGVASPAVFFAATERAHPAWRSMTIDMPSARQANVRVMVAEGNTFRPDLRWTMLLDPVTTAPVRVSAYATMSVGRRIRAWYRYTHTGEAFGVVGQIIATVASACAALLVWTGMALSWRRLARWRGRRSAESLAV